MTAEIVNLRKARKVRDRAEKERRAEENRAKFGRPKAERERAKSNHEIAVRRLEAHKRTDTADPPGEDDDP